MKKLYSTILIILSHLALGQTVDLEKVRINGSIPYEVKLQELRKQNIKIDNITAIPSLMDMSTADSLVYIGGTYFEYYNDSDLCYLGVIKLDETVKNITINETEFSVHTTSNEIQNEFPNSCKALKEIKIFNDERKYNHCSVPVEVDGEIQEMMIIFFFNSGNLKRIVFWEPS